MGHHMLPRTTQQSHSAASRREPQIEPWLAMRPPSCLSAPDEDRFKPVIRKCVVMRTTRSKRVELSAGAGCQEKQNLPAKGKVFFLDIPFYRTRHSRRAPLKPNPGLSGAPAKCNLFRTRKSFLSFGGLRRWGFFVLFNRACRSCHRASHSVIPGWPIQACIWLEWGSDGRVELVLFPVVRASWGSFCRPYGTGSLVWGSPRACALGCILSPLCG